MASDPPLSRLALHATSIADDLGYVALADLSRGLENSTPESYRIIGGHMVTALVARWELGANLYRETGDTDLGVPPIVVRDHRLLERLTELGYEKVAGNRFARTLVDIPVQIRGERGSGRQAIIDVLVPAYTSRARQNRRVSEDLVTTEVPGLSFALNRPPLTMALELCRLNGQALDVKLAFPDEVGALVLKSLATRVRGKATDIVDVWRCLEVAVAAGIAPGEFGSETPQESARIVRSLFATRDGEGMSTLITEQNLSDAAADERFTRLRALIARVVGS